MNFLATKKIQYSRFAAQYLSGVADTEEEVAELTLDQINAEIQRCLDGAFSGGQGSQGHKAFFKRLVWMEKMRENIHGIPAPRRVWHR